MAYARVLQVNDNTDALNSLLGTKYGRNGEPTFVLPTFEAPNGAGPAAPDYAICTQELYPN